MRHLSFALIIATFFLSTCFTAYAQEKPGDNDRAKWFKEMREKKNKFIADELQLTDEQSTPFFEIYNALEAELKAINDQTRRLERAVLNNEEATDAELDAAIDAIYNQRYQEWTAEKQAKEQLAKILSKKQIVKLKRAEAKFTRELMKQHRHARGKDKK